MSFDTLAPLYAQIWSGSRIGQLQREQVWRRVDGVFRAGDNILDLGCGIGDDALHLMRAGIRVRGIDASGEMVRIARTRGVDAIEKRVEEIGDIDGVYDGAISNFGALNCVADLAALRDPLAKLIRPGGYVGVCVIGRVSWWETAWHLAHGEPKKAVRRWSGRAASTLGVEVYYPTMNRLRKVFAPAFRLESWTGVGVGVPPSYVTCVTETWLERLDRLDRTAAHWPGVRALADHRLAIFRRRA